MEFAIITFKRLAEILSFSFYPLFKTSATAQFGQVCYACIILQDWRGQMRTCITRWSASCLHSDVYSADGFYTWAPKQQDDVSLTTRKRPHLFAVFGWTIWKVKINKVSDHLTKMRNHELAFMLLVVNVASGLSQRGRKCLRGLLS